MMGLIGIIIASLVNLFLASSALQFAIRCDRRPIPAGLTAFDTQKLKEQHCPWPLALTTPPSAWR